MSDAMSAQKGGLVAKMRAPVAWAIGAVVVLAGSLYYPVFFPDSSQNIVKQSEHFFFEANEAAGAPVLILSLWLFYRRSHYLDLLQRPAASVAASAFLALAIGLFSWGVYTTAPDLQLLSSIPMLGGSALLLGGKLGLRAFWLPILFLGFALPVSPVLLSAVLYPVQLATAEYAGFVLNLIGVDSFVQGDQILRPENTFVVIETCSGMRTVITLTMLTVLLIDLFERRGWHALTLIVLAPIIAFLTNGIRVVTLVLNPYSDVVSIHNLQGIAMLLVGLTAIYLIDGLIESLIRRDQAEEEADALATVQRDRVSARTTAKCLLVVCGVLVVMHGSRFLIAPWKPALQVEESVTSLFDRAFSEWISQPLEPDYNFLGSVRFLTWEHRRVDLGGETVDVFLAVADEQQREQTILTPRVAWPASGLAVTRDDSVSIDALGGDSSDHASREVGDVRRLELRRGAKSILSYSWYERAGSLPYEWFRQAAALDRSPFVRPRRILALRLSTPLGSGAAQRERAEERIRRAYERLAPELENFGPTFSE